MKNFVKTFGTDLIVNDRREFDWFKDVGSTLLCIVV